MLKARRLLTDRRVRFGLAATGIAALAAVALSADPASTEWSKPAAAGAAASAPTAVASDLGPVAKAALPTPAASAAPAAAADAGSDVRGLIQSKFEAVIASRMTARIIAMPFRAGEKFRRGALLASFDCDPARARLNAAQAAVDAYRTTYETNFELDKFDAVGKNEVAVSKANLGKATAEAGAVAADLVDCTIRAPFDGIVVQQIAHAHEVAASGQPLIRIQNSDDLEIVLIVPSQWLTWLRPGAPFAFKVDETGETFRGQIARLGASVDPVSKTLRVVGRMTTTRGIVLPGMSGSAQFAGRTSDGKQG